MDFCEGYETDIEDDRRSRYYNSLASSMPLTQRTAFRRLLATEDAYVREHASEVDQGGTISPIRTMGSQSILNDLFHTDLVHFERGRWPALSTDQTLRADAVLQHQYEKTLLKLKTPSPDDINDGVVTPKNLSSVEKSWDPYRDAWLAFALLRYPGKAAMIRAEITLERYRLLKTI